MNFTVKRAHCLKLDLQRYMTMTTEAPARPLQRVLLTGAASGIGAQCAEKLHARDIQVTAMDIVKPRCPIKHFCPLDLEDESSIEQAIEYARHNGPYDALLNIAGIPPRPNQTLRVLKINWLGQRKLTEGVLETLNPGGSIVNMASRAGGQWQENLEQVKSLIGCADSAAIQRLIDDVDMDATRAYNLSKEAMIVWSMTMTEQLRSRNYAPTV